jgi:hypothetical protein
MSILNLLLTLNFLIDMPHNDSIPRFASVGLLKMLREIDRLILKSTYSAPAGEIANRTWQGEYPPKPRRYSTICMSHIYCRKRTPRSELECPGRCKSTENELPHHPLHAVGIVLPNNPSSAGYIQIWGNTKRQPCEIMPHGN